jgi:hypothetical protein
VGWATNEVAWPISAAPATSTSSAAPAKRRRDESHGDGAPVIVDGHRTPPQKRVRGDKPNGIFKAAWSAAPRTHRKSVTRIPKTSINYEPKQPVRGAERLATPYSHGFHHRSLLGPSLQQGWAEEAADGQLIWVEGSVEEMARRTDSTVQQQQQQQEQEQEEGFEIPKDLRTGYRGLLVATQADWTRGAVREIKCRLCPDAEFKKWGEFKRHCECTETHPLTIYFCEYCGDYFARSDSCQRHCENRPPGCLRATPDEADAKRTATQREHDEFIRRLEGYLTTGEEDIGVSFSKTIKDMYPKSSKKRIRGSKE